MNTKSKENSLIKENDVAANLNASLSAMAEPSSTGTTNTVAIDTTSSTHGSQAGLTMHSKNYEQDVLASLAKIIAGQEALRSDFNTFKREITQSVEFQGKEIKDMKKESEKLHVKVDNAWDNINVQRNQLADLWEEVNKAERFSRRNNIRLIGVPESEGENVNAIVTDILTSKLKMENVEVERAHRDGKPRTYKGKPVHRHILIKLLRYKDKINIFKNWRQSLEGETYRIADDLTKTDLEEKRKWKEEVADLYSKGIKLRFSGGLWRDRLGKKAPFYTHNAYVTPQEGPYPGWKSASQDDAVDTGVVKV